MFIKLNSVKTRNIYVSSDKIEGKVDNLTFPWKYKLTFTDDECLNDFMNVLKSYGCDISKLNTDRPKSNDDWETILKEFDWYDMPEYDFDDSRDPYFEIFYRIEDKDKIDELILPKNKKFKIKTPEKLIEEGDYIGAKKYTISYECPDIAIERQDLLKCEYTTDLTILPNYPIYVISLSRYTPDTHLTITWLEKSQIPYFLVVEPFEKDNYIHALKNMNSKFSTLLVGERDYHLDKRGGIPVRNFVYNHSKNILKTKRHWILDDNIREYERRNKTIKKTIYGGVVFRIIEDYVDRYKNVRIAGHDYSSFNPPKKITKPITYTKVFSSILISNEYEDKEIWKGTYNEDLDLSIREWIDNRPVMLFRNIVCNKIQTGLIKGGNQVDIYNKKDWSYLKAKEIVDRYKDKYKGLNVSMITNYLGRPFHHKVEFDIYRIPILKDEFKFCKGNLKICDYNMKLISTPKGLAQSKDKEKQVKVKKDELKQSGCNPEILFIDEPSISEEIIVKLNKSEYETISKLLEILSKSDDFKTLKEKFKKF